MIRNKTINLGNLLLSLSDAIDLANSSIARHQQRVAYIAAEIARELDLPDEEVKNIFIASLLHDAGALSVEEKVALHSFEKVNVDLHAIMGESLLGRIHFFSDVAEMVRYHHRKWMEWEGADFSKNALASQIISLADFVERIVVKNEYILKQVKKIIETVVPLSGTDFNRDVVSAFIKTSEREEFWFDLVSPRLYSMLFYSGPLRNIFVAYSEIKNISILFRDLIDYKSPFTATHSTGVSRCAEVISGMMAFSEEEIMKITIAGNLHDLGKLIIPISVLNKPGILDTDEYDIIRSHSYHTYNVLSTISGLDNIPEWASFHHEKLNGKGYPFRKTSRDIELASRIIAVSDIFTALSEDRPYRKRMDRVDVKKLIKEMADKNEVDSDIVKILMENYDFIEEETILAQSSAESFYSSKMNVMYDLTPLN